MDGTGSVEQSRPEPGEPPGLQGQPPGLSDELREFLRQVLLKVDAVGLVVARTDHTCTSKLADMDKRLGTIETEMKAWADEAALEEQASAWSPDGGRFFWRSRCAKCGRAGVSAQHGQYTT